MLNTITFHRKLSHCGPNWPDSSTTITIHRKTFTLQPSQFLSIPILFLTPIKFYSILSHCGTLYSNPSRLYSSYPVTFFSKNLTLWFIQLLSVSFCINTIHHIPPRLIVYCHIAIYFVPSHTDWIHHLLSQYIARTSFYDPFSSVSFEFIVSNHITWQKLYVVIHSVPFSSFQFLSIPI